MHKARMLTGAVVLGVTLGSIIASSVDAGGFARLFFVVSGAISPVVFFAFTAKGKKEFLNDLFPSFATYIFSVFVCVNFCFIFISSEFYVSSQNYRDFVSYLVHQIGAENVICWRIADTTASSGLGCSFFNFHHLFSFFLSLVSGLIISFKIDEIYRGYVAFIDKNHSQFRFFIKYTFVVIVLIVSYLLFNFINEYSYYVNANTYIVYVALIVSSCAYYSVILFILFVIYKIKSIVLGEVDDVHE